MKRHHKVCRKRLRNIYSFYKHISIFANMPYRGNAGLKDSQHWKISLVSFHFFTYQYVSVGRACCKVTDWAARLNWFPTLMLMGLDAHSHLSVILICILHALSNFRIGGSLSVGYIEHSTILVDVGWMWFKRYQGAIYWSFLNRFCNTSGTSALDMA